MTAVNLNPPASCRLVSERTHGPTQQTHGPTQRTRRDNWSGPAEQLQRVRPTENGTRSRSGEASFQELETKEFSPPAGWEKHWKNALAVSREFSEVRHSEESGITTKPGEEIVL